MATADARRSAAAALSAALADVVVYDHLRVLDAVDGPTVLVGVDRVELGSVPYSTRGHALSVWVTVPNTDPGPADDALDDHLDAVLAALDDLPQLTWSSADRDTYLDAFPAYRITATTEG